ncbi:MAG: cell wall metabolism sensor histidine kinase WalK, partial [Papillibacter sp.]|nr:cell wall metabolism sensor histidine kinase WalK [Papillibacter sp.]
GKTPRLLIASDGSTGVEITPNILTALQGRAGYLSDSSEEYMDVAIPLTGANNQNSYIIYIKDNKQTVEALTMQLFLIIMESLIVGLVISILLSFLLSKTMVIPIQSLTKAANRIATGDFSERIEVQAKDEIGVLTQTFNNMAAKLNITLKDIENERNKLATVFQHMTDGVLAFSNEGEIIHCNPAAERMLELNNSVENLVFDDIFGEITSLERVLALKKDEVIEAERDIGSRSLEIFITPFYGEAANGGILVVIHDITVQRRSDEQRREFVANVSHELRTPITNVRSYAETLSDYGSEISEEERNNFLNIILSESDRMTKIVQDLLALSKFDAGEIDFKTEVFDVTESARSIYEAMRLEVSKQGLKLSISLPAGAALVEGDKARIEQVIINIVSNAVRYTSEGGIDISVTKVPGEVRIMVKDTGIGIPKKDIPRIFERFYRVDKARSRAMGGTGLGLSISYEIVRRHNGRIEIESEEGKGTAITVCLPSVKGSS